MLLFFHFICSDKTYQKDVKYLDVLGTVIQSIILDKELFREIRVNFCSLKDEPLDFEDTIIEINAKNRDVIEVHCEYKSKQGGKVICEKSYYDNNKMDKLINTDKRDFCETPTDCLDYNNYETKKNVDNIKHKTDETPNLDESFNCDDEEENEFSIFIESEQEEEDSCLKKMIDDRGKTPNPQTFILGLKEESQKEERNVGGNFQELLLVFKTRRNREVIKLIGNHFKQNLSFYVQNKSKIELFDLETNTVINDAIIKVEKAGTYKVSLRIKGKIKDFSYMFYECTRLFKVKGYIDTTGSLSFRYMFGKCHYLNSVEIHNFNVSSAFDFSGMFSCCNSLTNISFLKDLNFSSASEFSKMFLNCVSLSDTKGLINWDVSNVKIFSLMFKNCIKLRNLDDFKNWRFKNGNRFREMFCGCKELLNAEGIKTWNVEREKIICRDMFKECRKLREVPEKFR